MSLLAGFMASCYACSSSASSTRRRSAKPRARSIFSTGPSIRSPVSRSQPVSVSGPSASAICRAGRPRRDRAEDPDPDHTDPRIRSRPPPPRRQFVDLGERRVGRIEFSRDGSLHLTLWRRSPAIGPAPRQDPGTRSPVSSRRCRDDRGEQLRLLRRPLDRLLQLRLRPDLDRRDLELASATNRGSRPAGGAAVAPVRPRQRWQRRTALLASALRAHGRRLRRTSPRRSCGRRVRAELLAETVKPSGKVAPRDFEPPCCTATSTSHSPFTREARAERRANSRRARLLAADPEIGPGKGSTLEPLGFSKATSSRWQTLASIPEECPDAFAWLRA